MKHERIKELLPLYIDGGLNGKEKNLLKEHLKNCAECQKELKEYQENYNFLSSLDEKAPSGFTKSILKKVGDEMKEKKVNKNNKLTFIERIKNFFAAPVKIPAGVIGLAAIVLLVFISGFPGSILKNNFLNNQITENLQNQDLGFYGNNRTVPSPQNEMKITESKQRQNILLDSETDIADIERKIIKRADLSIEVKNIDTISDKITNLIETYNGYISDSRNWANQNKQKFYWFQLRIPVDNFNSVLNELNSDDYGQIISRSISGQDVTEEYMDLDIRLKNLNSQEERYRQLLDKADKVEEILKIENELNRIRTEIEQLQGRKKYLDNQISYSTITVNFSQPEPLSSGTPGIIKAIRNAVNTMVKQIYQIINLIGALVPYVILLILIYIIYKKLIR